jgi:hypothetical protein
MAKTQVIPANTGLSTYARPSNAHDLKNVTLTPHPAAFKIFSIIMLYVFLTVLSMASYSFTPVFSTDYQYSTGEQYDYNAHNTDMTVQMPRQKMRGGGGFVCFPQNQ